MGLREAERDGVRVEKRKRGTVFYPRCFFCLKEVRSMNYIPSRRYVCPGCKPLKTTFKRYYEDRESQTLFDAISREKGEGLLNDAR